MTASRLAKPSKTPLGLAEALGLVLRCGFENSCRVQGVSFVAGELSRLTGLHQTKDAISKYLERRGLKLGSAKEHGFDCLVLDDKARRIAHA
ncbi:MAG: hypothetical protein HQK81_06280 [Desulfovibrionaceae bacterium]|nr:hypothetical protein [Desulfovibrionaceae bacterium]MBF0513657.1 hypothetical protein [Desulfovibrionaceae bacterium]